MAAPLWVQFVLYESLNVAKKRIMDTTSFVLKKCAFVGDLKILTVLAIHLANVPSCFDDLFTCRCIRWSNVCASFFRQKYGELCPHPFTLLLFSHLVKNEVCFGQYGDVWRFNDLQEDGDEFFIFSTTFSFLLTRVFHLLGFVCC